MKIYEKMTRPASEYMALIHLQCDLCGEKNARGEDDWGEAEHDVKSVVVRYKEGIKYPDDFSMGTEYSFEICPKCFIEKLIPWFASQGAAVTETEWNY